MSNDTLIGGAGDDTIIGGKGDDILLGEDGNDIVLGEEDNDTILGGAGDDTILGGDGDDIFNGEAGIDLMRGGDGNDTLGILDPSDVLDTFDGEAGTDTVLNATGADLLLPEIPATWTNFEIIDGGGRALLGDSAGNKMDFTGLTLVNVAYIDGADGNDVILGSANADTIIGGSGDDEIQGSGGNDIFNGQEGEDTMFGGAGSDTLGILDADDVNDTFVGGSGTDYVINFTGTDLVISGLPNSWSGYEVFDGGNRGILGDSNNNLLDFSGLTLANVLGIVGQLGDDTIIGWSGDDLMAGTEGKDILTGGGGNNVFVMGPGFETEIITDFVAGKGTPDRIDLGLMGPDFDTFEEVMQYAFQEGNDTYIDFETGEVIILENVDINDLAPDDFSYDIM